jgi:hypothetical protein
MMASEERNPYVDGYSGKPLDTTLLTAVTDAAYQGNIIAAAYERVLYKPQAVSHEELLRLAKSSKKAMAELRAIEGHVERALAYQDVLDPRKAYRRWVSELRQLYKKRHDHIMDMAKRDVLAQAGL